MVSARIFITCLAALAATHALALEYPVGSPQTPVGMKIAADNWQPVETASDGSAGPAVNLATALDSVKLNASITAALQKFNNADNLTERDVSLSNYRGDLTASLPWGSIGDSDGQFFSQFRFGQGRGARMHHAYTSNLNSLTFEKAKGPDEAFALLAQVWYQLKLPFNGGDGKENARDHLYFTVGQIDPFVFFDQDTAADDESSNFLNNIFVHNPLLDSGGDIGADNNGFMPGMVVNYANSHHKGGEWALSAGAFSAGRAHLGGANHASFLIAQAETRLRLNDLPGTWRAYLWSNSRVENYDGQKRRNTGWGLSLDQKVTDSLMLFGRYGHHKAGKVRFDRAITLGGELLGTAWRRGDDALGLAFGNLRTSDTYRQEAPSLCGYSAHRNEQQVELYFRYKLNSAIELTPSAQWLRNAGGDHSASSTRIIGMRAKISF